MSERRTDDATLISAMRTLARTIQTDDGVIGACLAEAAARLESLVEERRWIPVGERLPEKDSSVLVAWSYHGDKEQAVSQAWHDQPRLFTNLEGVEFPGVTHWQPLPPGPEGDG